MTSPDSSRRWPSARDYMEAIQSPRSSFFSAELREAEPAIDRLGMPLVATGQFAYVFKLMQPGGRAVAVRCFRSFLGDRDERYRHISAHLAAYPVPCLADFQYYPEGILVNGTTYPILVLEWVEGSTLDVFLEQVLFRRETILSLADQWVRLVTSLRSSQMSHGDLQHGNIMIGGQRLRLVDPDGMFVPGLAGYESSELGHRHYQHPSRDTHFFDLNLDNFSALVIYLSLIALAERPALWTRFHDENLLFKVSDFKDPASSELFKEVKAISTEHGLLSQALETACNNDPGSVPHLADMVSPMSNLEGWTLAPPIPEAKVRTREAEARCAASLAADLTPYRPDTGGTAALVLPGRPAQGGNAVPTHTVSPNAPSMVTSRPAPVIARKKHANATATKPLPTLNLYQTDDSWILGRFENHGVMGSGIAYSVIIGILGILVQWPVLPALDHFFSALGPDPFYPTVFAAVTYVCLCLMAGFGLARFKNRKNRDGAPEPSGGGTAKLPHS